MSSLSEYRLTARYFKHILPHELAAYEALGWKEAGRKLFALDETSITMEWSGSDFPPMPTKGNE